MHCAYEPQVGPYEPQVGPYEPQVSPYEPLSHHCKSKKGGWDRGEFMLRGFKVRYPLVIGREDCTLKR